ncbi:MAG: TetR/AcrR family transcriptional regulator [Ilumatobacteraceae bacterium]
MADRTRRSFAAPRVAASARAASGPIGEAESDGRHQRRARNRDSVVAALLGLYREGNLDPSADEIAERSGVSARSVFRYFDDVDDLARAALDKALADVAPLIPIAAEPGDPTATKIRALLDERERLWESHANVLLASRVRAPFQPALAENIAASRLLFRQQVRTLFAPEAAALRDAVGAKAAEAAITAVHLLCTFENWHILRVDHGLTTRAARATITTSIDALLRLPA